LSTPRSQQRRYLLALGRLVSYKRFDLAVAAADALGAELVVTGTGPELQRLRALAGPTVHFAGYVDQREKRELLAGAEALLFPGEEDFGMVPVEALAAGCPVVAYAAGGALDIVSDGDTGILFDRQDVAALVDAIERLRATRWDEDILRSAATAYTPERFKERFAEWVRQNT
jgi:glycosyltransferase involved in cell wall biosynthesis